MKKHIRTYMAVFFLVASLIFSGWTSEKLEFLPIDHDFFDEVKHYDEWIPVLIELRDSPVSIFTQQYQTMMHSQVFEMESAHLEQHESNYRQALLKKQQSTYLALSRHLEVQYQFEYTEVLNGFALLIKGKDIPDLLKYRQIFYITDCRMEHELFRRNASYSTGVSQAWQGNSGKVLSGKGITIGIIDSGIDGAHPEFNNKIKGGEDFSGEGSYQIDANFHGTHVAGIAAGLGQNKDSKGMAFEADLMVYKVASSSRPGISTEYIFKAIDQSVKDKCHVVNLSLGHIGGGENSRGDTAMHRAVRNASSAGVFVVAAIGNSGSRSKDIPWVAGSPAIIEDAFAVAASNDRQSSKLEVSSFTSMGISPDAVFKPEISAPGVDIHSAIPKKYGSYYALSGTSMASPVIAGIVGLIKEANPEWSHTQIKSALMNNAELIKNPLTNFPVSFTLQGAGQARVERALKTQAFMEPRALVIENWHQGYTGEIEVTGNASNLSLPVSVELFVEKNEKLPFIIQVEPKTLQLRQGEKAKVKITLDPDPNFTNGIRRSRYEGLFRFGSMHVPFMAYMETVVKENNAAIRQGVSDIQMSSSQMILSSSGPTTPMQVVFSLNTGNEQTFEDLKTNSNYGSVRVFLSDSYGMEWSRRPVFELNNAVAGYYSFTWNGLLDNEDAIPSGMFCFKAISTSRVDDEIVSPLFTLLNHDHTPLAEPTLSTVRMAISGDETTLEVYWDFFSTPLKQFEITLNYDDRRVEDMEVILHENPFTPKNPIVRRTYVKLEWEGRWRSELQEQRYKVATLRFKTKGIGLIPFSARCFVKDAQNRSFRAYPYLPELNLSRRAFLLADFNQDTRVDIIDLSMLSRYFDTKVLVGSNTASFDLNQDRLIDENDLSILLREYGLGT